MTDRKFILRFVLVAVLLGSALTGVAARLVYLHLGVDEATRARAEQLRSFSSEIVGRRGMIHEGSASGSALALNLPGKGVYADPSVILTNGNADALAAALSRDLELAPAFVMGRITRPGRKSECLRRFVPEARLRTMHSLKLKGVFTEDTFARYYPHGTFMAHVLGFVNNEGTGSAGIEQTMEQYLRGCSGLLEGKVDARRRILPERVARQIPPQSGADVYLTVDQTVQYIVEQALSEAVARNVAKGGWAVAQRIRTGEVLALASLPAYDPNRFMDSSDDQRLNRTIGYVYEPGSTLKAVVVAAALNEGIVTPFTVFDCENGAWLHQGKILRDFHPYGTLNVADIIKKSSNIGAAKIALLLGDERLDQYLRAFGFGQPLGIDLPGEERGILHPVSRWSKISASRIAMGQGISVTSLQMLGLFCAVANDGYLMKPYVVRRVVRSDGAVLLDRKPEILGRPISAETAAVMTHLLTRVTEEGGTGRRACVAGYEVAGKTGTAQKVVHGVYSETDYVASFVGFLPADEPEIGIVVVIDEPQPLHVGGVVAAPVFSRIADQVVRYLDVPAGRERITELAGVASGVY